MKHNIKVMLLLILLFLGAHFIGLIVVQHYTTKNLPFEVQNIQVKEKNTSYIPIFIAILISSIIALIMIKFRTIRLWKFWFFLSMVFSLTLSFGAFFWQYLALSLAIIISTWRILKPNFIVHNLSELFLYGGLAALFVPIFNILSISILLILISLYDMFSVWQSKHMIKLAKFQNKSRIFAGIMIPYKERKTEKLREAILGGGDIGFTLLFSGVILLNYGMISAIITSIVTSIALLSLFIFGEKKKFYPAMPFLSLGCFISLGLVYLIF